jgi:histone deacetylase 6
MNRLHDATQVFFMGIGDAYIGLVDFLSNYGKLTYKDKQRTKLTISSEDCTDPESVVECLIGFVAETTIQSIKRPTDDTIAHWYHAVSYAQTRLADFTLTLTSTALQDFRQE